MYLADVDCKNSDAYGMLLNAMKKIFDYERTYFDIVSTYFHLEILYYIKSDFISRIF